MFPLDRKGPGLGPQPSLLPTPKSASFCLTQIWSRSLKKNSGGLSSSSSPQMEKASLQEAGSRSFQKGVQAAGAEMRRSPLLAKAQDDPVPPWVPGPGPLGVQPPRPGHRSPATCVAGLSGSAPTCTATSLCTIPTRLTAAASVGGHSGTPGTSATTGACTWGRGPSAARSVTRPTATPRG